MKTFAVKALLFVALLVLLNLAVLVGCQSDRSDYFAANIDKDRLLEQTPSPRIIFVGGSNLAFSVDSEQTEQALGLPVVNMGLHAGLGLRYMLSQVEAHLRTGDTVVVSAEYQFFSGDVSLDGEASSLGSLVSEFPTALRYMHSPRQFSHLLTGLLEVEQAKVMNPGSARAVYMRAGFNAHGDMLSHLGLKGRSFPLNDFFAQRDGHGFNPEAVAVLNDLSASAAARGARVYLIWPAIPDAIYTGFQSGIDTIYQRTAAQARFTVLGLPQAGTYPLADFFDSAYHMNAAGRAANTLRIVEELKAGLAESPHSLYRFWQTIGG